MTDTTHQAAESFISSLSGGENTITCLTCGQCVSRCFLNDYYPEMNPRRLIRKVLMGRSQDVLESDFIWSCTICGRCTTDCPKEIKMEVVVRGLRNLAAQQGRAHPSLTEGIEKALQTGNVSGMDAEEFVDTVEWLAEEAEEDIEGLEEGEISVPMDVAGADILYIPNPREYTVNPQRFSAYLKFFTYTGTNWTMSSTAFDITNWAYYLGDEQSAGALARRLIDEARRLGVKQLTSTECGHGFKILRQDVEQWLGEPLGVEVISIVELAHRYFMEGRLKLKRGAIKGSITYHDPCNVGRKLGIYEEPRELVEYIAEEFIEMWPNRRYGICCGGGGSVVNNQGMAKARLAASQLKHDQIMRTGADILTTCCQNCLSQLEDMQSHYKMPMRIKSVMELLAEAMEEP